MSRCNTTSTLPINKREDKGDEDEEKDKEYVCIYVCMYIIIIIHATRYLKYTTVVVVLIGRPQPRR